MKRFENGCFWVVGIQEGVGEVAYFFVLTLYFYLIFKTLFM